MTPHRGRVAIDVTPRVFSDALTTLLTNAGLEVVSRPHETPPDDVLDVTVEDVSVLVTSEQPDQADPLTIVIHLPESDELPRVRLTNGQWVPLDGIADVIRFVRENARSG